MKEPDNRWERRLAGKPPIRNGFTSQLEGKVRERIRMKRSERKAPYRPAAALLAVVLLLGCGWWFRDDLRQLLAQDKKDDALTALLNDPLEDQDISLTVLQSDFSRSFDTVRKLFIIRHPSVSIDMIGVSQDSPITASAYAKKYVDAIDKSEPDIIVVPFPIYSDLAAEGKLKPLDALIKQNQFDLDSFHQPLIEMLRAAGGGQLYGLPTTFDSTALYVNRELFENMNIPLPEDGAGLDGILDTAARFAGTGVAGLTTYDRDSPASLALLIGQASGLQALGTTTDGVKATVRTDGWSDVWKRVAGGYRDGWLATAPPLDWSKGGLTVNEMLQSDLFASGKAAMAIAGSNYYGMLADYEAQAKNKIDWSVQTYRLDPSAANEADYLNPPFVYAISSGTAEGEAAWELLRFIAGPEMAAKNDREDNGGMNGLLARQGAMKSQPGSHWEAFYRMGVDPELAAADVEKRSDSGYIAAYQKLSALADEQMKAVIDKSKTADQALEQLQSSLEQAIAAIPKESGDAP